MVGIVKSVFISETQEKMRVHLQTLGVSPRVQQQRIKSQWNLNKELQNVTIDRYHDREIQIGLLLEVSDKSHL